MTAAMKMLTIHVVKRNNSNYQFPIQIMKCWFEILHAHFQFILYSNCSVLVKLSYNEYSGRKVAVMKKTSKENEMRELLTCIHELT